MPPAVPAPARSGGYPAEALRVIDGDTLELRISVFPGHDIISRVRLARIDAPELSSPCAHERDAATAARRALRDLVANGPLVVRDPRPDKYFGRVVADVSTGGLDISDRLMADGMATPYDGGRRRGCRR